MVKSPSIVAYHCRIPILIKDKESDHNDTVVVELQADMDDWYSDDEVIEKLSKQNPGCKTLEDLVFEVNDNPDIAAQIARGSQMRLPLGDNIRCGTTPL